MSVCILRNSIKASCKIMDNKKTKACLICATEYHVFNCITIALNRNYYCFESSDIYICEDIIERNKDLLKCLNSSKLFDNILVYSKKIYRAGLLYNITRCVLPQYEYKHMLISHDQCYRDYDCVFIGTLNRFSKSSISLCSLGMNV